MKKESTKRIIWGVIAALLLSFFNCTVAKVPGADQGLTMEEPTQKGDVIYEENDEDFVNGINQAYLKERGITEEELLKEIQAEFTQEEEMAEAETRGIPFGYNGFFDVNDMISRPYEYFTCTINNTGANSYIDVGVNRIKLNEMVSRIPEVQLEDTRKTRIWARNFRLGEVTGNTIYISAQGHIKKYKRFWRKYIKYLDIEPYVTIAISYRFDAATQEIVLENYKITKVGGHLLLDLLRSIFERYFSFNRSLNQRIPFNFLPKKYLRFDKFYTTPYYLYTRLQCNKSDLTYVVRIAEQLGFDRWIGEHPPLFITGERVEMHTQYYAIKENPYRHQRFLFYLGIDEPIFAPAPNYLMPPQFEITRHSDGTYSIGSIELDPINNNIIYNSSKPTRWNISKEGFGNSYTIKSGSHYLTYPTHILNYFPDYKPHPGFQKKQWSITIK